MLTAYLAADANAGSTTGWCAGSATARCGCSSCRRTRWCPDRGRCRTPSTPTAAQNTLRLLNQGGSKVESGNLLTLPVGGGLLYVQPVFVRATGETTYPLLQYVFVSFGDKIGFATTLDAALDQVFGGNSGANAGDAGQNNGDRDGHGDRHWHGPDADGSAAAGLGAWLMPMRREGRSGRSGQGRLRGVRRGPEGPGRGDHAGADGRGADLQQAWGCDWGWGWGDADGDAVDRTVVLAFGDGVADGLALGLGGAAGFQRCQVVERRATS